MDLQDEIAARVESWLGGKPAGPVKLQLNPTDRCNLGCVFCWLRDASRVDYRNNLSREKYRQIMEEAARLGVRCLQITGGGEPLMRKVVALELMDLAKAAGMFGSLITNGTLIGDDEARRIVGCGWDEVIFSVDSPREKTHDLLRASKGCLRRIKAAIRAIARRKEETGSAKPKLCLHFVLCNQNYMDIPNLVRLARKLGCANVFVEPLVVVAFEDGRSEQLKMGKEHLAELPALLEKGIELCDKYNIENNLRSMVSTALIEETNRMQEVISKEAPQDDGIPMPCFEPWYNVIIRPNGRVGPCCMFDFSGEFIHDKTLEEIWTTGYFRNIRNMLMKRELPPFCAQCNPSQVVENRRIRERILKLRQAGD